MPIDRAEHIAWCKERAHQYLDAGDIQNAVTSMMSDMGKHPECKVPAVLSMLGLTAIRDNDLAGARRFIDGF